MSASLPQPLMTYQTMDDSVGQGDSALLNDSDWAGVDTGSLSWLIPEIREAFGQSLQSLTAFSQTPDDTTALRLARSHLHQAHGALQVVDLDGVVLMTEEVEHLYEIFESKPARCDADALTIIGAAFHGVIEYLEELMAGQPHQPLRMFESYAALLKLKGADRIHPSDLFFPDLSIRPPLPLTETRSLNPLEITQQRARFERGLLGYLRNESDRAALSEMAAAVATIETSSKQGQQRAFWWITRGFFEALQNQAIPQDAEIKKLVARINLQIRRLLDDSATIAERVLRDALYFVARARPVTDHIRDVQQVYRLGRALPQDFGVPRAHRVDAAKIRQVKELLVAAKKSWGAIVAGNVAQIPDFSRDSSAVLELSGNFGQPGLAQLALVIANIGTDLSFDPRRPSEQIGLDIASALLFLESVVEQINSLDSSFNARALQLVGRLDAAAAGIVAEEQIPWLDELASKAHERQTMGQFILEIQCNLQTVEKTLDAYFRDTSQRQGLVAAEGLLAQAGGALAVMGHDHAAQAIAHSRKSILRFAEDSFVPDAVEFERVAHTLGAVGFYVEQLQSGSGKGTVFHFDEQTGQFTAEIGIAVDKKPAELSAVSEGLSSTTPETDASTTQPASLEQETVQRAGDATHLMDSLRENPDNEMARDLLLTNLEQVYENALLLDDSDLRENAGEAIKLLNANENDELENALSNISTGGLTDRITELTNQTSRLAGQDVLMLPIEPTTPVPLEDDAEKIDAELLEIFLGEAQEVLETVQHTLAGLKESPASHDHLVTMRRAFHTLKGSGRMVGLYEFGDAAWGIEQTLNQQLSAATPVMPNLLDLLGTAAVELDAWVKELATQGMSSRRAQALVDYAAAVREGRAYAALTESVTQQPDRSVVALPAMAERVESLTDQFAETNAEQEVPSSDLSVVPGMLPEVVPQFPTLDEESLLITIVDDTDLPVVELYLPEVQPENTTGTGQSNMISQADDLTLDFSGSVHGPNPTNLEAVFQNLAPELTTRVELVIDPPLSLDSEPLNAPTQDEDNEAALMASPFDAFEPPVEDEVTEIAITENVASEESTTEESATVLPFPSAELPPPRNDDLCRIGHLTIAQPLYNIFLVEADELVRTVARDFSEWRHELERCGSETAFRAVHSLAGSSSTVGLDAVHDLARAIEGVLLTSAQQAAPIEPSELDLLDAAVESLRAMLHQFAAQFLPNVNPERIEELNALRQKLSAYHVDSGLAAHESSESADSIEESATEFEMPSAALDESVIEPSEFNPEFNASVNEFVPEVESASVEPVSAEPVPLPQFMPMQEQEAPVPAVASITAALEASQMRDDIDPELMEIFIQEANDYMPQIGQNLREWQADPSRFEVTLALQRQLHTVKGSARMAGAMRLGELIHEMETRVESGATLSQIPQGFFDELLSAHDHGLELLNLLAHPTSARAVHFQESVRESSSEPDHVVEPAPVQPLVDRRATARPSNQTTPMVRVRADVLDRLVNQAGEVSISRARLDNEIGQIRTSLNDLTDNLARLRTQLREIEIQGETQMQSQLSMAREKEHFDPLEFDRFTRFQELTRMMAESVEDIELVRKTLMRSLEGAGRNLSIQQRMTRDMQQDLMHVRMVPFSSVAERLYRVVRQAAKELDKRANLDIRGATVEIDRALLEQMVAPFEHLLRNAVVHGIESREERRAAGKEEIGELLVEARHEGNEIVLTFSDDGAGLNLARIRERAITVGLIGQYETLTDQRAADLIFQPGFTTATHVTELAGRGVGMDVVREEAAALGGRVTVESQPGKGSRFTVHLPLTLAVTQAVVLRSAGRLFALPAVLVEAVQQVKDEPLAQAYVNGHFDWQGKPIGLHFLSRLLGEESAPLAQRYSPVLILRSGGVHIALHVDEVVGNQEAVVKNVGPQLARMTGVAGATVLGSGEVVLILNPVQIAQRRESIELNQNEKNLRHAEAQVIAEPSNDSSQIENSDSEAEALVNFLESEPEAQSFTSTAAAYTPAPPPAVASASKAIGTLPIVMVVDDSLTVRRVTQRLLMREGYQVVLAKDGVDALQQMQDFKPDVMLVDIEMPRMDGFDLTRNIRSDERYRHIPIIMITSRTADKHRTFAMELGVNVYLGKPYQDDELLANIGAFTGKLAVD